eukprot:TRINITY_DN4086_c0_g2_i2.p1 TRINITY_DN4086_c0_g2~~TRINITY_DN4086_c0_g2_i2.p1  ORF type:complete len:349 (+),score=43.55 TRINITY_DN4086_c0_g2_i2:530-1576(+)
MVILLVIVWILVFLATMKGVKVSGKIAIVTVITPYVLLVILFFRGITLPGAGDGILYYITPKFDVLFSPQVWISAFSQIFFSLSPCVGTCIVFGSFIQRGKNISSDLISIAIVNSATSVFAGFVVFSVLGYMSLTTGLPIESVVSQGPGLAFIVYPEALSLMPFGPFFSVLFFLMLFMLGIDSMFGYVETVAEALHETSLFKKQRKEISTGIVCFILMIFGIVFTSGAGYYYLQLADHYIPLFLLFIIGIAESVSIGWFYPVHTFRMDIHLSTGVKIPKFFDILVKFVIPVVLGILLIVTIITELVVQQSIPGGYIILGWILAITPATPIVYSAFTQKERGVTDVRME